MTSMTRQTSTLRSNCRLATPAFSFIASLGLVASAWGADALSIKAIAPEDSILVVGIDDFQGMRSRFEKTPIGAWWGSKDVQDRAKPWRDKMEEGLDKMTQELGVPRDTLQWPTSFGMAMYAALNEETGQHDPAMIVFVDWSKNAESFGKLYDAAIAKMEKEAADSFTVEEIKGHRVYVQKPPAEEATPEGAEGEEDEGDPFGAPPMPNPFEKPCFTRDGSRLLVAGNPGSMQELLGSIENDKRKSIADTEDFRGTMELSGGSDAYVAFLTAPAQKLLATLGPQAMMATPFLSGLFGDIRGFGMGVSFDGKSAPVESSIGMYIPGPKKGLLSLRPAGAVEKIPAMVPADAISYAHMNFQFSGLMKVVDEFITSLGPPMSDAMKQEMEPFDAVLRGAFAGMGPSMHMWGTLKQPITAESNATTFAVSVSDNNAVQKMAQMFAPMAGLAPRDFVGNTVYSADDEFMPVALGLGGSYMFVGETEAVEQSLRALGQTDAASSLEGDPILKAVRSHWSGDDLVGYGYSNTAAMLEAQEAMFEQFAPMIDDAADDTGLAVASLDLQLSDLLKALDPKIMKEYFGPTTWELRSVKTGFRFDTKLLPVSGK
jgi:hypothetical protein